MKKITTLLCVAAFLFSAVTRGETPVITMTTSNAIGSAFTVYLTASVPNAPIQVDFGDGNLVDKTISTPYFAISGTLVGSQTVKIFGPYITLIMCGGNKLTSLDVTKSTALTVLSCEANQLTSIDVSMNTALTTLNCPQNQISSADVTNNTLLNYLDFRDNKLTSLDVTKNTSLFSLSVAGNQITSLDLGNLTSLMNLYCNSNPLSTLDVTKNTSLIRLYCWGDQLTSLDVTKNTSLNELGCGWGKITSLDLSKNEALTFLDCSNSQLTTLDVSHNAALIEIVCDHNKLATLDLSANTSLKILFCVNNQLTSVNVTKCTVLKYFQCQNNLITSLDVKNCMGLEGFVCRHNLLTSLDVSKNAKLTEVYCDTNQLATLDVSKNAALLILQCNNNQLTVLDLPVSTELTKLFCFNNQLTSLDLTKYVNLTDLECENNHLTVLNLSPTILNQPINLQNLFCENNELTFATLPVKQVSNIRKYFPQKLISIASSISTGAELDLSNQNILEVTDYTWKTKGGTTLVPGTDYTLTNGKTNFLKAQTDSVHCEMYNSLFADPSPDQLATNYTMVKDIPVMTMITAKAIGSAFNFSMRASAPDTQVQIYFGDRVPVNQTLGVSGTSISGTLALTQSVKVYGSGITYLVCNGNQLTNLDITQNTELATIFCDDNQLTSLDVSKNTALKSLSCSSNQLTFATLPIKQVNWTTYYYAPQKPISMVKSVATGIELDLSSQLTANGNTTLYTWKTKGGSTLVPGTDYTLTNGTTVFLKAQTDSVYCEMTNATFPDFTGDAVLKTTYTNVTGNVGLEENAGAESFQIYTRDKTLYINAPTNGQASVYDISGRLVANKEITSGSNTIAIQKGGVYLVRFTGNKVQVTKKVFIGN